MISIAHSLVCGAIASSIPDPNLAIPLAFGSHFIMDSVPHFDIGTHWRNRTKTLTGIIAAIDTILGFTLAYFIFREKVALPLLVSTIISGNLPDWLEAPYYIFFAKPNTTKLSPSAGFWERLTYNIYKTENIFHAKAAVPLGILSQIAVVTFFLLLLR
jgi:hypothetical protein